MRVWFGAFKDERPLLLIQLDDAHLERRMRKASRDQSRGCFLVSRLRHNNVKPSR